MKGEENTAQSSQPEEENKKSNDNDFSKGSIVRHILSLAVPMTLAQLINVLYNVVDRIYIGRIPGAGSLPLTGVGLCLPILSMVTAFANLFGIGGGSLISRLLGGGMNLLLGDLIEMQFLGSAYNPHLGSAISLVMMVIVLVSMGLMNRFGEGEGEAVLL